MEQQGIIGKRIGRFVLWMGLICGVTGVVVVTQRLSDDSLALIIGLCFGIAAMLPTVGLGVWLLRREMLTSHNRTPPLPAPAAMPPVVVVTPQALPGYGVPPNSALPSQYSGPPAQYSTPSTAPWAISNTQRHFTIVGGAE